MPIHRIACGSRFPKRRRSTILIRYLALDVAELDGGEADHDDHQDHGLRGRAAEIAAEAAVGIDLVDERLRRPTGAAARHGVDDAEGMEEGIDDIDDEKEESGRREQRKDDRPEAPGGPGAVDGRRLDEALRNRG